MDARGFTGGQFLKKEDVPVPTVVTIESYESMTFNQDERPKLVLHLAEFERDLVLNSGNIETLIQMFQGSECEDWIGKQFELYSDPDVKFAGRRVGGLRVREVKKKRGRPAKTRVREERFVEEEDGDDAEEQAKIAF